LSYDEFPSGTGTAARQNKVGKFSQMMKQMVYRRPDCYRVSARKGCFSPLAVSIFGFACAAYGMIPVDSRAPGSDKKLFSLERVAMNPYLITGKHQGESFPQKICDREPEQSCLGKSSILEIMQQAYRFQSAQKIGSIGPNPIRSGNDRVHLLVQAGIQY
jgi:hypothetical protein